MCKIIHITGKGSTNSREKKGGYLRWLLMENAISADYKEEGTVPVQAKYKTD